jgi:hypothetical protein
VLRSHIFSFSQCWQHDPSCRPSAADIVHELDEIISVIKRLCHENVFVDHREEIEDIVVFEGNVKMEELEWERVRVRRRPRNSLFNDLKGISLQRLDLLICSEQKI